MAKGYLVCPASYINSLCVKFTIMETRRDSNIYEINRGWSEIFQRIKHYKRKEQATFIIQFLCM